VEWMCRKSILAIVVGLAILSPLGGVSCRCAEGTTPDEG